MGGRIVNVEMAAAWDGDEGDDWVRECERYDRAVRPYHEALLAAVAVRPGDKALDIGCGNGESTRETARRAGEGSALGIDLSSRMIAHARQLARSQRVHNAVFDHGDVQAYPFDDETYDVCISRFGAMFFGDPDAAFGNFGRSVRHDGRLGLVAWRGPAENEWFQCVFRSLAAGRDLPLPVPGTPGPFGLADTAITHRVLAGAGFVDIAFEALEKPFWIGTDTEDACGFFRASGIGRGLTQGLDPAQRERAFDALQAAIAEHASEGGVTLPSSAWLVTARRA
jgi:SAM-dependent methyltransferase